MIPYLGCERAQDLLQPFVDMELPMAEQVLVESHLRWCDTCAARVEDMRVIGAAVRLGAATAPMHAAAAPALSAIQSEVLALVRAEQEHSLAARFRGLFADMRFLWPALGASAALAICLLAATAMNRVARNEHPDSMAHRIAALADPGSDRNPLQLHARMLAPRPLAGGAVLASMPDDEAVFTLAAVVTREGRVANFELLHASQQDEVSALLNAVKRSRFEPAQTRDGAVAVNVVWLLTRTTVKASIDPNDPGSLQPMTGPESDDEVVKPAIGALRARAPAPRPARS